MRSVVLMIVLIAFIISSCDAEPIAEPILSIDPRPESATYHTVIRSYLVVEENSVPVEAMVSVVSTHRFDAHALEIMTEYTQGIAGSERRTASGYYHDQTGAYVFDDAWHPLDIHPSFEEDLESLREPFIRLSEHLQGGFFVPDPDRSTEHVTAYAVQEAHRLFDASFGTDGDVEGENALILFDRSTGALLRVDINATVRSATGSMRLELSRRFDPIPHMAVGPPESLMISDTLE